MAATDIIRDAVRKAMHMHPGIRAYEIADMIEISLTTAQNHVKAIRAEWKEAKK
jgi:hypothetical protein